MSAVTEAQVSLFRLQSEQARGRSELYADLWDRLADSEPVAAIIGSPPRWDAPLRLLSGLHLLVLHGDASWDAVDAALVAHQDFLHRHVAEQAVQTNEVQRCWMLLPCFLEVTRRTGADQLDVIELGTSAGLNLAWDRYRYAYANGEWGSPGSPAEFSGEERRPVPREVLAATPRVRSRVGVDLSPIDITAPESAILLKSFVWADQTHRLDQLDRAITVTRQNPPELLAGDIAELLPDLLAQRRPDALTVVWQTAVLGYLSDEKRQRVFDALEEAGQTGPLAFISTTGANDSSYLHFGLTIKTWPDGVVEQVAHADFHGAWIDWLDPASRRDGADISTSV